MKTSDDPVIVAKLNRILLKSYWHSKQHCKWVYFWVGSTLIFWGVAITKCFCYVDTLHALCLIIPDVQQLHLLYTKKDSQKTAPSN